MSGAGQESHLHEVLQRAGFHAIKCGIFRSLLPSTHDQAVKSGSISMAQEVQMPNRKNIVVVVEGARYLVSMLGADADWVRNAKAAGGNVTLRHGGREEVRLEEVPPDRRAPVLKAYLKRAPGARPHLPVDKDAPLSEFERVSGQFPVFQVVPRSAGRNR
jgi:hypothetical protein